MSGWRLTDWIPGETDPTHQPGRVDISRFTSGFGYDITKVGNVATDTFGVDAYGAFGSAVGASARNAFLDDPRQPGGVGWNTVYESAVAVRQSPSGARAFWTEGVIGGTGSLPSVANSGPDARSAASAFTIAGFDVTLAQVMDLVLIRNATTTRLRQTYTLHNNTGGPISGDILRYLDADIGPVGDNGGGRRPLFGDPDTLFMAQDCVPPTVATRFLAIQLQPVSGGITAPLAGRYQILQYSALLTLLVAGTDPDNTILDDDGTGWVNPTSGGFDITSCLRLVYTIPAGEDAVFRVISYWADTNPQLRHSGGGGVSGMIGRGRT